jgi:tryptophan-rich sensory protein
VRQFQGKHASFGRIGHGKGLGLSPGRRESGLHSTMVLLALVGVSLGAGAGMGMLFGPDAAYAALQKPTWSPPGQLFGPVWAVLYALMGISAWLVWRERRVSSGDRRTAWTAFGVQAVLNLAWTPIFFGMESPGLALLDISLLWVAVLWTTVAFGRIRPLAGYLLVPYVLWVSFAWVLNGTIWLLNT